MRDSFYVRRETRDGLEYFRGIDDEGYAHTVPTLLGAREMPEDAADYLCRHLADNGIHGFYKSEILDRGSSDDDPADTVH